MDCGCWLLQKEGGELNYEPPFPAPCQGSDFCFSQKPLDNEFILRYGKSLSFGRFG